MTCLVGLKTKTDVWIGSDSACTSGGVILNLASSKTFSRDGVIIAAAGYVRPMQVLRHLYQWPRLKDDVDKWLYGEFIPGLQDALKTAGNLQVTEEQVTQDGHFLIGVKGRLFALHGSFDVIEVADEYYTEGCGREVAAGAMYATVGKRMSPKARIGLALEAATYHLEGVRPPFHIGSVRNNYKP